MARIQIPLDVFTSRLNLSDRLAGFRSQTIGSRFANIKPISEFLDFKRLSKPANFGEAQSRVNWNIGYFSSNYAAVFVMLSIYSLVTNPVLLFVIILVVGGMWAIGKLDGRDLELGANRITSSQLYTFLFIVAVPLGLYASPFTTLMWLIGARWERDQARYRESVRVEELDSDDSSDARGVAVNGYPARYSAIDIAPKSRKAYAYQSDSSSSSSASSTDSDSSGNVSAAQIALRDKEEALVQSALARIRRAQEKGKLEVKLREDELAALENRRKRIAAENAAKAKPKPSSTKRDKASTGGSERRKKKGSGPPMVTVPIVPPPEPASSSSRPHSRRHSRAIHPADPALMESRGEARILGVDGGDADADDCYAGVVTARGGVGSECLAPGKRGEWGGV
ncbi:hypothetical protein V502_04567 [Pseudogymnoascus sp. VKM F-4520 (FW-2644)]|nr:hypothetical protein V502_04567 [Pseudogymnoascus sp. VKM F-4520 (FW-2644)]